MITKTSQKGIDLIKKFEGCRYEAYKCPAGVWTIGYGHTSGVTQGMKISPEQAELLLISDLEKYEAKVWQYTDYQWNQNEFDALVSFAFNIGSIDQLTANGTRSKREIADKIILYNKAGGRVLAGLSRRRKAEQDLFLSSENIQLAIYPVLRYGSKGELVIHLQKLLKQLGYYSHNVDGDFGVWTMKAVIEFQLDTGLAQDGVVGKYTWAKLDDYT